MTRKRWLKLATFALSAAWAFRTFGPHTDAELSPKTTYITAPLAADGLPNYALAMLDRERKRVKGKENAAVLLWQAVGPRHMSGDEFQAVCNELGIDPPTATPYLTPVSNEEVHRSVADWLKSLDMAVEEDESTLKKHIESFLEIAAIRPWTAKDCPPLADWVVENETSLDLLVTAAARPTFFSPWPNLLANPETAIADLTLPHASAVRDGVQSLAVRAAHRVGQKRYGPAWQDCLACWRWAAHLADRPTLVERLAAIQARLCARDATLVLLDDDQIPTEILQRMLVDVDSLPTVVSMAEALDDGERLQFLDATLRLLTDRMGGLSTAFHEHIHFTGKAPNIIKSLAYDLNVPLRRGNVVRPHGGDSKAPGS